jgi:DnaJ-class molecular chaperone
MKEKTLYEILEVSENASGEIIEKAYKTLAKKYHPDLQEEANKKQAEAMMKKINEAYEILGNEEKRSRYDGELAEKRNMEEMQKQNVNQNYQGYNMQYQDNAVNNVNGANYDYEKERLRYEKKLQEEEIKQRRKMQEDLNREYNNAYENYLRSLGYRIKHRWTKENTRDLLITIGVIVVVFIILWFIPPTHDWMVNFYESNPIIKTFIDIIIAIVTGIFKGIWEFITGLFD